MSMPEDVPQSLRARNLWLWHGDPVCCVGSKRRLYDGTFVAYTDDGKGCRVTLEDGRTLDVPRHLVHLRILVDTVDDAQ